MGWVPLILWIKRRWNDQTVPCCKQRSTPISV